MGHIGCLFEGTQGSLVTNYTTHEVWVGGKKAVDFPIPAPTIPDSPGHTREFLDAIKARNLETTCNVRYGHRVTKPGLLSNIAFRTGRRIHWNDAAGAHRRRQRRQPLSAAQVPQGLQALMGHAGRGAQRVCTAPVRTD